MGPIDRGEWTDNFDVILYLTVFHSPRRTLLVPAGRASKKEDIVEEVGGSGKLRLRLRLRLRVASLYS